METKALKLIKLIKNTLPNEVYNSLPLKTFIYLKSLKTQCFTALEVVFFYVKVEVELNKTSFSEIRCYVS